MSDTLREFSDLADELGDLVKKWKALPPREQAQQEENFRKWHGEIAAKIAALSKPTRDP